MAHTALNLVVADIAIDRADGHAFEQFARAFMAALIGVNYVPLGGIADGGADGLEEVFGTTTASHFSQFTRQEDHRAKIRHTIKRLREVGRTPLRLTYVTSRVVPLLDQEEELLASELNVGITIRDRPYLVAQVNRNEQTIAAFGSYVATFVGDLLQVGATELFSSLSSEQLRSAVVFLSQELANRHGTVPLSEKIVDSLIIWSLRDTDPAQKKLMTRDQMLAAIVEVLPASKRVVTGILDHRISELSSRSHPAGRLINIYKSEKSYCLPFETRQTVQEENAADLCMKTDVLAGFVAKAATAAQTLNYHEVDADIVGAIALTALEKGFQQQGLIIASWVAGTDAANPPNFSEIVADTIRERGLHGEPALKAATTTMAVIRLAFTASSDAERRLFNRWSKTFALLFSLQNEPRVVEWIKGGSSSFNLYIGSDILIRALSEQYLAKEDRLASNALEILNVAGSKLVLAEPVADEIWTHIKAADHEFRNHYANQEPYLTLEFAQSCSRILIQTYLYARMSPIEGVQRPRGWISFLDGMVPYETLHTGQGKFSLIQYLCARFGMSYENSADLQKLVDPEELDILTERFTPLKQHKGESAATLARNDAMMVLSIYGKRAALHEEYKPNPFGYRTWWLTNESSIRRVTSDMVSFRGVSYMMTPDFIMQYVALNPNLDLVVQSYARIFPSTLGISIGASVPDDLLHDMLARLDASSGYDDARLKVEAASLSNRLMADFGKQYRLSG